MITRHEGRYFIAGVDCYYDLETGARHQGTQPGEQVKARFEECEGAIQPGAVGSRWRDGAMWFVLPDNQAVGIKCRGDLWFDKNIESTAFKASTSVARPNDLEYFYKLVIL